MNLKIHQILPVLIALFIPGVGFITSDAPDINLLPILYRWAYTSLVLFLLWHALLLSKRFGKTYAKVLFSMGVIVVFVSIASLSSFLFKGSEPPFFEIKVVIQFVVMVLVFSTIQYALESQKRINSLLMDKEQLSKENYRAQLQSLRNQIDPHFLFNSLNTLRSLVRQKKEDAEDFILSLSAFYRSTLNHNERNTLSLKEELDFLDAYLVLMKARNTDAVQIQMEPLNSAFADYQIPCFAVQSVVENCFKHNSMSSKHPLIIKISYTEEAYIAISNTIQPKLTESPASGKGLALIENRYHLLGIPNGVVTLQDHGTFSTKLKLIKTDERIDR